MRSHARSTWPLGGQAAKLAARLGGRCVRNEGDAMVPLIADGAYVAYAETDDPPDRLEGMLVVAWVGDRALVRWFQRSGQFAVLRAQNPAVEPIVVALGDPGEAATLQCRRVLWISTPH